ncbi:hypothetical protein Q3O60_15765 [Alkalimonas collagenimarina]|uniref:Restriction endonuclease type IV Mrr domain-containing protein n=1 Tax=Alkalimonas collagenimarina TaxID=400390 RepID=A0ABT9H2W4_9GAMM|nr:hypothetical protein [Alkalimonas collagenimarina]MDP4537643.1 hypothetical protein [Alkalimonas collagenimarina]
MNKEQWYEMSWREFEVFLEGCIEQALAGTNWRLSAQRARSYVDANGGRKNLRLDFHVAERRQGGRSVVIDARHYKTAYLRRHDADAVDEYRRKCRAAEAIIITSPITCFSENLIDYCFEELGIALLEVNRNIVSNLRRVFYAIEHNTY